MANVNPFGAFADGLSRGSMTASRLSGMDDDYDPRVDGIMPPSGDSSGASAPTGRLTDGVFANGIIGRIINDGGQKKLDGFAGTLFGKADPDAVAAQRARYVRPNALTAPPTEDGAGDYGAEDADAPTTTAISSSPRIGSISGVNPVDTTSIRTGPKDVEGRALDYMKYLVGKGVDPKVAAGMIGNAWHESAGFNSGIKGDSGKSVGLYQFYEGGEQPALRQFAGADYLNPHRQHDFVLDRLQNGPYKSVWSQMGKAASPGDAAVIFSRGYERPRADVAHNDRRAGYANRAYALWQAANGSAPPPASQAGTSIASSSGISGGIDPSVGSIGAAPAIARTLPRRTPEAAQAAQDEINAAAHPRVAGVMFTPRAQTTDDIMAQVYPQARSIYPPS